MVGIGTKAGLGVRLFVALPGPGCDQSLFELLVSGMGFDFGDVDGLRVLSGDNPPPGFLEVPVRLEVPWLKGGVSASDLLGGLFVQDIMGEGMLSDGAVS